MPDIQVNETLSISDGTPHVGMTGKKQDEYAYISEGKGVEITLRLENTPFMVEIPRVPTMQTMGCEEEGFE